MVSESKFNANSAVQVADKPANFGVDNASIIETKPTEDINSVEKLNNVYNQASSNRDELEEIHQEPVALAQQVAGEAKTLAVKLDPATNNDVSEVDSKISNADLKNIKGGVFIDKVLPNLNKLYEVSSVFSFLSTPLTVIPKYKDLGDKLQRAGYCIDTFTHQLRGIFTKGEKKNLFMMVPTATAFLGTVFCKNDSFVGQLTRNMGNLCHLGFLKDNLDFVREAPESLPAGTQDKIFAVHDKFSKATGNPLSDMKNDFMTAVHLAKDAIKNPKIIKAMGQTLVGNKNYNVPHAMALSGLTIGAMGAAAGAAKIAGKDKLAWALNKNLAIVPILPALLKAQSSRSMKDPDLKKAGDRELMANVGTLGSALLNFKFVDAAMATRALFMGVNTMAYSAESKKIFKAAQTEMLKAKANKA
jgi:hypothetical protein